MCLTVLVTGPSGNVAIEPALVHFTAVEEGHIAQIGNVLRPAGTPFTAVLRNGGGNRRRNNPGSVSDHLRRFLFSMQVGGETVKPAGDLFPGFALCRKQY